MSWSFNAIGRPDAIAAALAQESNILRGHCKAEFDAALPHMLALLAQNYAVPGSGYNQPLVEFTASGSGYVKDGVDAQRECMVQIKRLYASRILLDPPKPPTPEPCLLEPPTPPPAAPQSESDAPMIHPPAAEAATEPPTQADTVGD